MTQLNEYLQPIDAPVSNYSILPGNDFYNDNERGIIGRGFMGQAAIGSAQIIDASITNAKIGTAAIGTANIGTLSFNEITGGTATLGGTVNGNGVLMIKDASGAVIVQGDNLGNHYYNTAGTELVKIDSSGFHGYGTSGVKQIKLGASTGLEIYGAIGQSLIFKQAEGSAAKAYLGYDSGVPEVVIQSQENALHVKGAQGLTLETFDAYDLNLKTSTGAVKINGATKTAIVPTSLGYNALYCIESPEVWFMDFAEVKSKRWYEFWKKDEYICSPLFLETIEKISYVIPTTDKNIVQVWGIRKGFNNVRFEEKTKEEFTKNNAFWSQPNA